MAEWRSGMATHNEVSVVPGDEGAMPGSFWIWLEPHETYVSLLHIRVIDGMHPRPNERARLYVPAARWMPGGGLPEDWPMEGD